MPSNDVGYSSGADGKFRCGNCIKVFHSCYALKDHMANHTGSFAYHCTSCQKGFSKKMQLAGTREQMQRISICVQEMWKDILSRVALKEAQGNVLTACFLFSFLIFGFRTIYLFGQKSQRRRKKNIVVGGIWSTSTNVPICSVCFMCMKCSLSVHWCMVLTLCTISIPENAIKPSTTSGQHSNKDTSK